MIPEIGPGEVIAILSAVIMFMGFTIRGLTMTIRRTSKDNSYLVELLTKQYDKQQPTYTDTPDGNGGLTRKYSNGVVAYFSQGTKLAKGSSDWG